MVAKWFKCFGKKFKVGVLELGTENGEA